MELKIRIRVERKAKKGVIMKIGIIGSGNVGGSLGKIWAAKGHEVMFSSRHPDYCSGRVGRKECVLWSA